MPDVTLDLGNQYIGSAYSPQVAITETETGHEIDFTFADSEHPGQLKTEGFEVPNYASEEAEREAAEAERAAAESARVAAEEGRMNRELDRVFNENARINAEELREDAETARASAEQARAAAETARASAENSRASAEQARTSAESARASAESGRATAESARVSAEQARATAESARASAEAARESAEATRQANTTAAIARADAATAAANTATTNADAATTAAQAATGEAEDATDAANAAAALATAAAETVTDAYFPDLTAGAAEGITGGGPTDTAAWLQRACPGTDGPATIESIHGNTVVESGELLSVQMEGIESADADGNVLTSRTIPATDLRSAGTVYDEQTATERITRVGAVDLGTLTWSKASTTDPHWRFYATLNSMVAGTDMTCQKYETITTSQSWQGVQGITSQASGSNVLVMVSDETYSDSAAFKAAMDGVILYYALATQITTPINPPLNLTYKAAAGGTERILHTDPTAAPTLVVTYGSTADGIRDRALAAIAPVENGLASANYSVGTYLIHGGQLCRVTTAIAAGEAITIGTNVVATTVMAEVIALTQ